MAGMLVGLWGTGLGMGAIAPLVVITPAQAATLTQWRYDADQEQLEFTVAEGTTPTYFLLAEPARIVVDLPGTDMGAVPDQQTFGGSVRLVRVNQFQPGRTRIVLELSPTAVLADGQVELQPASEGSGGWVLRPLFAGSTDPTPDATPDSPIATVPSPSAPESDTLQPPAPVTDPLPTAPLPNTESDSPVRDPDPVPSLVTESPTDPPLPIAPASPPEDEDSISSTSPTSPTTLPPLEPGAQEIPVAPPITSGSSSTEPPAAIAPPELPLPAEDVATAPPPSPSVTVTLPEPVTPPGPVTLPEPVTPPEPITPSDSVSDADADSPATPFRDPEPAPLSSAAALTLPPSTFEVEEPITITVPPLETAPAPVPTLTSEDVAIAPSLPPQPSVVVPPPSNPGTPSTPSTATAPLPAAALPPTIRQPAMIDFGQPLPGSSNLETVPTLEPGANPAPDGGIIVSAAPGVLIPADTVLNLRYPGPTSLELEGGEPWQEVLLLTQTVRDSFGNVLIPAGSQIIGQFETSSSGSKFVARALSVQGRNIQFRGESDRLGGDRDVSSSDIFRNSAIGGAALTVLSGFTGIGLLFGLGAGAAATYLTSPQPAVIEPNQIIELRVIEDVVVP